MPPDNPPTMAPMGTCADALGGKIGVPVDPATNTVVVVNVARLAKTGSEGIMGRMKKRVTSSLTTSTLGVIKA
jgi:hypothetical protein